MAEPEAFDQFIAHVSKQTWALFRDDVLLWVLAAVVLSVAAIASLGLMAGPLTVGFIELVRQARRGEPLALSTLFSRFDTFVPSLVAMIIIGIAVGLGMVLFVLPGLLAMLFATWTFHAIAYEGATGVDALRRSIDLVRGNFAQTVALMLLISIAHSIGGAVVFGVLLTAPLSLIALTVGFERLTGEGSPHVLTTAHE